ncbi:MAG: ATP-binding cassette domain-containing protein, partial [Bellilinea sp.]|nr:ATP-binding cassette domain-containing protein [Bellilinea sp.]
VNTADVTQKELAAMMVGRETFGIARTESETTTQKPALEIINLCANDDNHLPVLKNVSLTVYEGEILGIAGVGGNGQKELAETICGVRQPTAGKILVEGQDVTGKSPLELTRAGLGRIPEDRHEGMVMHLTVTENLVLEHLDEFTRNGTLDHKAIRQYADDLIQKFQIKAKPNDITRTLSGGNMQKVLLARVLARQPKVIIAPQPTRGLDIGATDYVRQQLLEQRQRGAAILLISEDLDEILALSDRIAVIYEGEIVGTLPASEATPERLGLLMAGAVKEH